MILVALLYFAAGFLSCLVLVWKLGDVFMRVMTRSYVAHHRENVIETLEYTARTPTALAKVAAELGDAHGLDDALRATARAMRKEGLRR